MIGLAQAGRAQWLQFVTTPLGRYNGIMVAIKGHFDGKVIVPDEPLNLRANQRLLITLQPVNEQKVDFTTWVGSALSGRLNPLPQFNSDDDLWNDNK